MKNFMISKKQRKNKAEDFSGVDVRGQEVFMEGSNEEFDDQEELKVEKGVGLEDSGVGMAAATPT